MPISVEHARLYQSKSRVAMAVKKFLDEAPTSVVFTTTEVVTGVHCGLGSVGRVRDMYGLQSYSMIHGRDRLWGNPKAITALKKALAEGK